MPKIDYFFAPYSSFSYLAGQRLEAIAARHDAQITYKPVDLVSLYPRTGGKPVAERHESRRAYRLQDLRRQAKRLGMPINLQPAFGQVNGAPAAYAIISAQRAGGGDLPGLVHGYLRAVWAEERNIADPEVVEDILAEHGFDRQIADRGMLAAAEIYANNLEEAAARGVFGAPFYIVDEERFWGQDRLDDLDLYLSGKL
ncbi:MAG: 2-hydroxychromene-2-carboxylate isomerase [Cereibacter sphaeroides]|uniref:2-hydroxychromene-2-carboxylate isomerase n=1 Tax=Cereibacter sphaeroides TaxID=1063 RepID=A0A2W5TX19_CERSP|nr:MAG: 2-hydroxychromene-2-carboxylate isomerase [Cereibacter sphaeroides]